MCGGEFINHIIWIQGRSRNFSLGGQIRKQILNRKKIIIYIFMAKNLIC